MTVRTRMSQRRRLAYVLALNLAMIAGLVVVGVTAHSLSVLAAGGDYVADSLAIVLGLLAVFLRDRRGNAQATSYVALVNGLLLLGVTAVVGIQAVWRLVMGNPEVHGLPVLIVAASATAVMLLGALILGREAGQEDLHMRSILLDTVSDAVSSAAVAVVGGILLLARGLSWLDSVAALVISLVIAYGALRLLRDVARALRQGTPLEPDDD
jgi:cobalt-zinc-cadmium efflux system protein